MAVARLTSLRIAGLRTLADVTLLLDGLTVLVGENGTGKSTIVEALELVRCLARADGLRHMREIHGPPSALLRLGASSLSFAVGFEHGGAEHEYGVELVGNGTVWAVAHEHLGLATPAFGGVGRAGDERPSRARGGDEILERDGDVLRGSLVASPEPIAADRTFFSHYGPAGLPACAMALVEALDRMEVHLPFDVMAGWGARTARREPGVRGPVMVGPTRRLGLLGGNLVEAFQALRSMPRAHWEETLEYLRLGLGMRLEQVVVEVVARGYGELFIDLAGVGRLPAAALSDGQLSYLAMVAMIRLGEGRTLLALDEPEAHLDPELLVRVVELLEAAAERHPVLVSTQSDRLLDALSEPATSTVVCELDSSWSTRLHRLDPERLARWLRDYRGLGAIRAGGDLWSVVASDRPEAADDAE